MLIPLYISVAISTAQGVSLRESAWINATTGAYRWIDDHARWIQRPGNAADLGLPDEVVEELGRIPWDFNGSRRETILRFAMDSGLIRARGHGASTTFEFTIPWEQAVRGARKFMSENFGPNMQCRFNCLSTGQSIEIYYGRIQDRLDQEDLSFLLPPWQRPRTRPPVERPFLVAEVPGEGWRCWPLPADLDVHGLVDLVRGHVPEGGGWMALTDGRTWKITPSTPPLISVGACDDLRPYEICPDCGWPRKSNTAPCQCRLRTKCPLCQMPTFWPVPMHDHVHLDGTVTYVPHFVAYAHKCLPWPAVKVLDLQDLLGRS